MHNLFTLDDDAATFEAVRFGADWNGFATPVVSREVMEAWVSHNQTLALADPEAYEGCETFAWDGDDVVGYEPDSTSESCRLAPDADGLYDLGVLGRAFMRVGDEAA